MDEKTLTTIGGLARHFNVSTVTIRKWEEQAGVTPIREETGNRRLYLPSDIRAIEAWLHRRPQRTNGDEA